MSFWSKLGGALKAGAGIGASFIPGVGPVASRVLSGIGAAGDAIGTAGQATGEAAKGFGDQRILEAQVNQGVDRNMLDRARLGIDATQSRDRLAQDAARLRMDQGQTRDGQNLQRGQFTENATMDRAKLGIEAPMARTKQAAFGDALANIQDLEIDFQPTTGALPTFKTTGGLRPSMFGANARGAGKELSRQALMALMTKSDVPAMTELAPQSALYDVADPSAVAPIPELQTGPTKAGKVETGLGVGGTVGSIFGALAPALTNALKKKPQTMLSNTGGSRIGGLSGPAPRL